MGPGSMRSPALARAGLPPAAVSTFAVSAHSSSRTLLSGGVVLSLSSVVTPWTLPSLCIRLCHPAAPMHLCRACSRSSSTPGWYLVSQCLSRLPPPPRASCWTSPRSHGISSTPTNAVAIRDLRSFPSTRHVIPTASPGSSCKCFTSMTKST